MKKIFIVLFVLILLVVGGLGFVLFSKSGNALLRPLVESALQKEIPLKVRLERFELFPMHIMITIGKDSIAKIDGKVGLVKSKLDLVYLIDIKNLAALQKLTKVSLRGPLKTKGKIFGSFTNFAIVGSSDIARSATNYKLTIKEFEPKRLNATIKHLQLSDTLYMLRLPHYADASIDATLSMQNLMPEHLQGTITSSIVHGRSDEAILAREFGLKDAKISFDGKVQAKIEKAKAHSDISLHSNVADFKTTNALFDIKDSSIVAPYEVSIPNLDKLYFVTKKHMRGSIVVKGEVRKKKDLILTAHSDTLGGKVDMKMVNSDVKAKMQGIKFVKLTDMLIYPRIFDSLVEATLHYDLHSKKGKLLANAFDGHILPNKMSFLLEQMANFDITKEIYKKTTLKSDITDMKIVSDLDMISRLTHISAKRALVDLAKNYVEAKLRIDIKNRPLYVKVKGALQSPKISIDAKSLVKERAKRLLQKKLQKSKLPPQAKELLKFF